MAQNDLNIALSDAASKSTPDTTNNNTPNTASAPIVSQPSAAASQQHQQSQSQPVAAAAAPPTTRPKHGQRRGHRGKDKKPRKKRGSNNFTQAEQIIIDRERERANQLRFMLHGGTPDGLLVSSSKKSKLALSSTSDSDSNDGKDSSTPLATASYSTATNKTMAAAFAINKSLATNNAIAASSSIVATNNRSNAMNMIPPIMPMNNRMMMNFVPLPPNPAMIMMMQQQRQQQQMMQMQNVANMNMVQMQNAAASRMMIFQQQRQQQHQQKQMFGAAMMNYRQPQRQHQQQPQRQMMSLADHGGNDANAPSLVVPTHNNSSPTTKPSPSSLPTNNNNTMTEDQCMVEEEVATANANDGGTKTSHTIVKKTTTIMAEAALALGARAASTGASDNDDDDEDDDDDGQESIISSTGLSDYENKKRNWLDYESDEGDDDTDDDVDETDDENGDSSVRASKPSPKDNDDANPQKIVVPRQESPATSYNPNHCKIISIPPGTLGLTVRFHENDKQLGATINAIHGNCPFKDKVEVGDRIVTVDGRQVTCAEDVAGTSMVRETKNGSRVLRRLDRRLRIVSKKAESECYVASRVEDFLSGRGCLAKKKKMKKNETNANANALSSASAATIGKHARSTEILESDPPPPIKKKRKLTPVEFAREVQERKCKRRQEQKTEFYKWHNAWQNYQKHQLDTRYAFESASDGWAFRCKQIEQYKQGRNDEAVNLNKVALDYKADDDFTFGEWIHHQRKLYQEGKLTSDRVKYLEEQGLDFSKYQRVTTIFSGDEEWDKKLLEMIEFRKANGGNCDIPNTYPTGETLGQWVHRQREEYFAGTLDNTRHELLEAKGFLFEPGKRVGKTIIDPHWMKSFRELKQFKHDHGHLDIPNNYRATSLSAKLDVWLYLQKKFYRRNELSFHRMKLLEEFGVDLAAYKKSDTSQAWEKRYNELLEFLKLNGHCRVPTSDGGLGGWVRRQRKQFNKGVIHQDRLQRLLDVGFNFDPRGKDSEFDAKIAALTPQKEVEENPTVFESEHWMNLYDALKRYVEINGHASVSPEYNDDSIEGNLYVWLETQKRFFENDDLPQENVELLEDIGVELGEKSSYSESRHDVRWNHTLSSLRRYYEQFGNGKVHPDFRGMPEDGDPADSNPNLPFCGNTHLGRWLVRQRQNYAKGKLSEKRRIALEELGVDLAREEKRGRPKTLGSWCEHPNPDGQPTLQKLAELNAALTTSAASESGAEIRAPPAMPDPKPQAMRAEPVLEVGGIAVGITQPSKPAHRVRCKDLRKRKDRECKLCSSNSCEFSTVCNGRAGRGTCKFYEPDGVPIICNLCEKYDGEYKDTCRGWSEKNRTCLYFENNGSPK